MNEIYDSYLKTIMESEFSDAETVDGKKKLTAEQKKKILKGIAACVATIAAITALIVIYKKIKANAPDKEAAKAAEEKINEYTDAKKDYFRLKELLQKAMREGSKQGLDKDDLATALKISNSMEAAEKRYKESLGKVEAKEAGGIWGKKMSRAKKLHGLDALRDAAKPMNKQKFGDKTYTPVFSNDERSEIEKLTNKYESASDDTYDRLVDTICEKYNNNEIDANTCVALLERANERYATYEEQDDYVAHESTYDDAVEAITEKYMNGEIDENTSVALLERAADLYSL